MNFTDLRILKTQERLQNALLELLDTKELKEITVKEICEKAGISRNAFYQHYGYKEDLYDQMVARATEGIRDSLMPIIQDASAVREETIVSYAEHIVEGISEVRELIYVMLKGDDGKFLRQLTDLIFGQNLTNALSFFDMKDSEELRLYYEFQSAGMAAFIIKWILDEGLSEEKAAKLLAGILLQSPGKKPVIV
ncbi:transcriptional regulator, TetR family [[Clostridium] aminophilum]|uniref:Transcriptional regulator, TetR family n=1 Tax=[Clostridium] aminophilum TaxID=1526 RepID=A0A1I0FRH9_9FIRM|nr:TetR/AcrR family transcriptional regulator [[Clostridium] aminophilum]SET60750.1 transcriptional regulator, TetR family [[Clostridium] aminophilum]